ncbi:hypothetical protein ACS0TY_032020 [Phlomoides rotata]
MIHEKVLIVFLYFNRQKRPSPRCDHRGALHAKHYLFILGGCYRSVFFTDLHVLDLERMEWSQPSFLLKLVHARAGHAGVAVDGNWYIVSSKSVCETGNHFPRRCPGTLVINMSTLDVSVLNTGLSISSITRGGENILIAFGGYNGKCSNEVFALRIKPSDSSQPPAAAALETVVHALSKSKKIQVDTSQQDLASGINSLKDKKALEPSLATNKSAFKIKQVNGSSYAKMYYGA